MADQPDTGAERKRAELADVEVRLSRRDGDLPIAHNALRDIQHLHGYHEAAEALWCNSCTTAWPCETFILATGALTGYPGGV